MNSRFSKLLGTLAIALSTLTSSCPSHGATIEAVADRSLCRFRLNGEIVEGDAKRAASVLPPRPSTFGHTTMIGPVICLNSPGGSWSEGIALAELFLDRGIATAVDDGEICVSACAIAFIGGRTIEDVGSMTGFPTRILHVGGKLGFHAPSLQIPAGSYDSATVNAAYEAAIRALGRFTEFGARASNQEVRLSLISALLRRGQSDFEYVDTVGKATRWRILLTGYSPPGKTRLGLFHACQSEIIERLDISVDELGAAISARSSGEVLASAKASRETHLGEQIEKVELLLGNWSEADVVCKAHFSDAGAIDGIFPASERVAVVVDTGEPRPKRFPPWRAYPPVMALSLLRAGAWPLPPGPPTAPRSEFSQHRGMAYRWSGQPAVTVTSIEQCRSRCSADHTCRAFTYFNSRRLCRLMETATELIRNDDADSGTKR